MEVKCIGNTQIIHTEETGITLRTIGLVSDRALIFPIPLLSQLQGWPGCQKIQFFLQINLFSFCARFEPKLSKFQKTVKIDKKNHQKTLFSYTFLNILQLGGNISAPNLIWHVQWILAHLLTPLGPLGPRQ